jgi:monofunctional biosynthetic peptidoglycan transglycosylase
MKRILRVCKYCIIGFLAVSIFTTLLFSFVNPPGTPLMLKRYIEMKLDGKKIQSEHEWVPLEEISPNLVRAVIASEDNHFTSHFGIDMGAIKKARKHNEKHKKKRGASTISQQVAKNVFLWPQRTYLRKGFEVYFTLLIETFWSKRRIMEVYLNMIEMGPGIYGAEAAAQHYFHKPASKLTSAQSAMIAICLPNPRKRNPAHPTSYMIRRQQQILYLMPRMGKIDL